MDSGCDITAVPKALTDRYRRLQVKSSTRSIWAANNTPNCVYGETEILFDLNERCMWTPVLITEDVKEIKLGIDWLKQHNCVWNFSANRLTVDERDTATLTRKRHFRCRRVLAKGYSEIPSRSEKKVVARVTLLYGRESPKNVMIDAKQLRPGLHLARTLLSSACNEVKVRVANTTNKPQSTPLNICL